MADIMSSVIPFLFVLAVVYGALEVSDIFKRKQVKLIISLSFAYVAMTTEYVAGFIMGVLPYAILAFIVLFFLGFALSFARGGKEGGGRDYTLIVIVLVLALIFMTSYGLDFLEGFMPGFSSEEITTGAGLLVMAIIFYSVYRLWGGGSQTK
jgi:hypothetical protein